MKHVEIDGVTYQSLAEAARALGVSRQAIWLRLHPQNNRDAVARFKRNNPGGYQRMRERHRDPREGYDIDF
jgi:Zn-dependent peptidase ImmA (M78 family)